MQTPTADHNLSLFRRVIYHHLLPRATLDDIFAALDILGKIDRGHMVTDTTPADSTAAWAGYARGGARIRESRFKTFTRQCLNRIWTREFWRREHYSQTSPP